MSEIVLPYTFENGTAADATQVDANFDAINAVVNGNLDDGNVKTANKDGTATTASLRTLGVNAQQALSFGTNFQVFTSVPTAGATALFEYEETGINFATACSAAWLAGWKVFNDSGHSTPVAVVFNAFVAPKGKHVEVGFQNDSGVTLYPQIFILAIGH